MIMDGKDIPTISEARR